VLRERGRLREAVEAFGRVIEIQPDHYEAHQNLGSALAGLCQFDAALKHHQRALELRPQGRDAYRHLGAVYYALGRPEEAAAIYRQWLAIAPHDPVAGHMLASCMNQNVPDRASDDFIQSTFDNYAPTFDNSLAQLDYRAPTLVAQAFTNITAQGLTNIDILDVGCGTGLCAPHLRPYARRLTGVDLSERMLTRARERDLYDDLVQAELTAYLEQHSCSYSLIVSADTLVYFGPLDAVMRAVHTALRPEGYVVFTVERSQAIEAPNGYRIHPHGRYSHTEDYVQRVLQSAGMQVIELQPVELRKEAGKWVAGLLVAARK